jgi:sugar-specific transcriptional regulator TrmB
MNDLSHHEKAIEQLQQLGLKEYEAKAFVALSRLPSATAKEISDISEVPRTRVYDAVRVLETKGLVEIQHSNPQQFRAVSISEAIDTFRAEYESRLTTLRGALLDLEPVATGEEAEATHEIWALSGSAAIASRTGKLISEAEEEVVLVIGDGAVFTETLTNHLRTAQQHGVKLIVGTPNEQLHEQIQESMPSVETFVSGLEWVSSSPLAEDETNIGRMLLVDRSTILVSSFYETGTGEKSEQAVFGRGFENGVVAVVRRLVGAGFLKNADAGEI